MGVEIEGKVTGGHVAHSTTSFTPTGFATPKPECWIWPLDKKTPKLQLCHWAGFPGFLVQYLG